MNDDRRLDELEDRVTEHLNELLSEVARRDEWLIDSIWNVVIQLSNLTVFVVISVIVLINGYTDGWPLGLAVGAYFLVTFLMGLRSKRLQADDKIRIGRGSILGPFASWWK